MTLYAKRLNHGRSEIWIDDGLHRDTATNNLYSALEKYAADKLDAFRASLHEDMGSIASVEATPEIIAYLGLA